ncbi:MAG: SDR family NAD(P)-dependent oxidoreductase [Thermotogae bacterium]|nr:SDR family NAD(P)-dependent oxidoreductase [Thermotogota bacterium]
MNLKDRGVLLTGATRGIGRETLRLLIERGARVVATGRDEETLREIRAEHPGVFPIVADLEDPEQRRRLVGMAAEVLGGLDVLINNAGFGIYGPYEEIPTEDMRRLCEVNFWAPLELTREALPFLKGRGMVLNVVSMIAFVPLKGWAIYSASKAAMRSFFLAVREELRPEGVKVINVYPPVTRTDFFKRAGSPGIRRVGSVSPQKVASAIVKAIEREREEVFVSFRDRLLAHLGCLLAPLAVRLIR